MTTPSLNPAHLILFNPSSGRGRGEDVARELFSRLRDAGHHVDVLSMSATHATSTPIATPVFYPARVLFIIGGDGTVHRALDFARREQLALYHIPMGTENLFSREFGMSRDLDLAIRSLEHPQLRTIDLATCASATSPPSLFAIMCSVGPDAAVIRRLSAARTGPIRHASYVAPIASELVNLEIPPLSIHIDGEPLVRDEPGLAVVANSRQYAMRVDPAHMADMSDGLLDLIFFPAASRIELLTHLIAARLRRADENASVLHRRARHLRITSPLPSTAYQLDGEAGTPPSTTQGLELTLSIVPSAVRVLLPATHSR